MRTTICQLPNDPAALETALPALFEHVRTQSSDLLLLPEMPFSPWLAARRDVVPENWQRAVETHEAAFAGLSSLAPTIVASSRPVIETGRRLNRGIVLMNGAVIDGHDKYYLPEEPGFWEASWYERGDGTFIPVDLGTVRAGFQICTEMWFMERGRAYGRQGVQIILVPRATDAGNIEKWIIGGRALAVVSGCFVLSSNLCPPHASEADLGGVGFIADPNGRLLAMTDDTMPFVTIGIDLAAADAAKSTYPRYVKD